MPAITIEDTTVLKRLPQVGEQVRQPPVRLVTEAPKGSEGEGFPVRRAFAGVDLSDATRTSKRTSSRSSRPPTPTPSYA